jgi:hypothetical protein
MIIYNYNRETGEYLSESLAHKNPLEKDKFLIPAYATDITPTFQEGKLTKFKEGSWVIEDIPDEPKISNNEQFTLKTQQLISVRLSYLYNTDYKIIKQAEGVENCSIEILEKRTLARKEINEIELATTLEELQIYLIQF